MNRDRYITVTGMMARGHALSEGVDFVTALMEAEPLPAEYSSPSVSGSSDSFSVVG